MYLGVNDTDMSVGVENGSAFGVGTNNYGQIGLGTVGGDSTEPVQFKIQGRVVKAKAGYANTCLLNGT